MDEPVGGYGRMARQRPAGAVDGVTRTTRTWALAGQARVADCVRMALDASELVKLALALLITVFFVALAIYAYRKGSRSFAEAQAQARAQLAQRGYARQVLRRKHSGPVTRLWGPLLEPSPIYLRVLNNDGVAVSVGDLVGVADLKVGHPRFDGNFVVRSNFPDAARAVLDDAMQRRLMSHRNIDFSTGAVSNLLGADHCAQHAGDCDLRTLWCLRAGGDLSDAQCEPLVVLARDLVARLQAQAAQSSFAAGDYRVGQLEGL